MMKTLVFCLILNFSVCTAGELACKAYGNGLSSEILGSIDEKNGSEILTFSESLAWYAESLSFELVYSGTLENGELVVVANEKVPSGEYRNIQTIVMRLKPFEQRNGVVRYGTLDVGDFKGITPSSLGKYRTYSIQCFNFY